MDRLLPSLKGRALVSWAYFRKSVEFTIVTVKELWYKAIFNNNTSEKNIGAIFVEADQTNNKLNNRWIKSSLSRTLFSI